VVGVALFTRIIYIKCPDKCFFGFVPAFIIKLGSFEVKAGIKEKPPVLISTLPV
jgi:hypothetical protein